MQTRLLFFALLAWITANFQSADRHQVGAIKGEVVDAKGSPIAGAKVFDEPIDAVRIGKDHFTLSDERGLFFLEQVPVGKTMVIATKTEDGYPDARFAVFSGNETLPIVQVASEEVTSNVVVR